MAEIFPIVSLRAFEAAGRLARREMAEEVDRICRSSGFLAIADHGVDEAVIDGAWNAAKTFYPRKTLTPRFNAKPRQRIAGGNRHTLAVKLEFTFQFFKAQNDVMVIAVVGENVAPGSERSPGNPRLIHFINDGGCLRFLIRREDPVNRATNAQTG